MTQLTKFGAFNVGTGAATTTVAVTGVGFTPKALLLWWSGETGTGNTLSRANVRRGIGLVASTSDRRCLTAQTQDTSDPLSCDTYQTNAACIASLTTAGAVDGLADLQSFDSDGFTLVIDDAFATDLRVMYLAFGGTDITAAKGGIVLEPAATGNQATTGVGFTPSIVFFLPSQAIFSTPGTAVGEIAVFGAAVSAAQQAVVGSGQRDGATTSEANRFGLSGECLSRMTQASTAVDARAALVSQDADGFTLNWIERSGTNVSHQYMAIAGGDWAVGEVLTRTDTNPITVTGLGFEPSGLLFVTHGTSEATTNTVQPDSAFSMGGATGPSNRGCQLVYANDAEGAGVTFVGQRTDAVAMEQADNTSVATLHALLDLTSIDSDGFTAVMDDTDDAAGWVMYVAAGGGQVAPPSGTSRSFAYITG